MEKIIEYLKRQILACKEFDKELNKRNWRMQQGVLLTANEAQRVVDTLEHLQHYRDSTIGLWATDRPDKIIDPEGVLFQLKDE